MSEIEKYIAEPDDGFEFIDWVAEHTEVLKTRHQIPISGNLLMVHEMTRFLIAHGLTEQFKQFSSD